MVAPGGPIQVGSGRAKPQHGATTMKRTYEVADRTEKRAVAEFLKQEGARGRSMTSPSSAAGDAFSLLSSQKSLRRKLRRDCN